MNKLLLFGLLALFAGTAAAQDVQTTGSGNTTGYINRRTGNMVDVYGNILTTEATPFYDLTTEKLIITNVALANATGDSCVAFDNHRNSLGVIAWKIVPTWAAQTVADYAVQVRYHYQGATDTSSVFPLIPIRQLTNPVPAPTGMQTPAAAFWVSGGTVLHAPAAATSLGFFSSYRLGSLITGPGIAEGTRLVSKGTSDSAITVTPATTALNTGVLTFWTGSGADSTGQMFNGSGVLPYPSEFRIHLDKANITGSYSAPQAFSGSIPLPQYFALGVCPTYISVRIRNINGPTSAVTVYYTSGP